MGLSMWTGGVPAPCERSSACDNPWRAIIGSEGIIYTTGEVMDLNKIMQLANDPQVRSMLQSLLKQFTSGGQSAQSGATANLMGMVQQLDKSGLTDQVKTWTGSGANAPVTGAQLKDALGAGTINQVAQAAGTTPDQAADSLAGVLPQLIDSATTDGAMPESAELSNLLGGLMK